MDAPLSPEDHCSARTTLKSPPPITPRSAKRQYGRSASHRDRLTASKRPTSPSSHQKSPPPVPAKPLGVSYTRQTRPRRSKTISSGGSPRPSGVRITPSANGALDAASNEKPPARLQFSSSSSTTGLAHRRTRSGSGIDLSRTAASPAKPPIFPKPATLRRTTPSHSRSRSAGEREISPSVIIRTSRVTMAPPPPRWMDDPLLNVSTDSEEDEPLSEGESHCDVGVDVEDAVASKLSGGDGGGSPFAESVVTDQPDTEPQHTTTTTTTTTDGTNTLGLGLGIQVKKSPVPPPPLVAGDDKSDDDDGGGKDSASNGFFGVPLDQLLSRQRVRHPCDGSLIPRMVRRLCLAVLRLDGQSTVGVFRVPGKDQRVAAIRAALRAGERVSFRAASTSTTGDSPMASTPGNSASRSIPGLRCHDVCSLLKQWLRALPGGVVPQELRSRCMDVAEDPARCYTMVHDAFPAAHRDLVLFLVGYVRTYFLPDDVVAKTHMGPRNLSVIFGACVLPLQGADRSAMLRTIELQQKFFASLLLADAYAALQFGGHASDHRAPSAWEPSFSTIGLAKRESRMLDGSFDMKNQLDEMFRPLHRGSAKQTAAATIRITPPSSDARKNAKLSPREFSAKSSIHRPRLRRSLSLGSVLSFASRRNVIQRNADGEGDVHVDESASSTRMVASSRDPRKRRDDEDGASIDRKGVLYRLRDTWTTIRSKPESTNTTAMDSFEEGWRSRPHVMSQMVSMSSSAPLDGRSRLGGDVHGDAPSFAGTLLPSSERGACVGAFASPIGAAGEVDMASLKIPLGSPQSGGESSPRSVGGLSPRSAGEVSPRFDSSSPSVVVADAQSVGHGGSLRRVARAISFGSSEHAPSRDVADKPLMMVSPPVLIESAHSGGKVRYSAIGNTGKVPTERERLLETMNHMILREERKEDTEEESRVVVG